MYCALAQSSKRKELDRNVHVSYTSLWAHNASGDTCLSHVDLHVLHSSFYLCITGAVRQKSPWAKQRCVHSMLPPCQPANILGLDCLPQPRISTPPTHNPPTCGQVVMRPSQPDVPLWSVKQCGNHYTVQDSSPSSRWLLLQFDKAASFSVASLICVNKSKASKAHEAKDGGTWSVYHAFKPWRTLERKIVSRGREKGHLAVRKCVHARNWGSSRHFLCMQSWSMFLKWTDLICCEFPGLMLKRNLFNLIKHHEIFCSRQQELWAFPQRWEEDSRCQR